MSLAHRGPPAGAGVAVPLGSKSEIVLHADGVYKRFGDNLVLHNVNLKIGQGQTVALVGPSGCGKSTLLKIILGILESTEGAVLITQDNTQMAVQSPGPDRGIVFQTYGLMPFLTAEQNVALGPELMKTTLLDRFLGYFWPWSKWRRLKKKHLAEARRILTMMGLGESLEKYPTELSGGMRQRVAIAQAIITKPRVLLLDEPFGALDEATREALQTMLLEFYETNVKAIREEKEPPYTIFIVTHELNEAIYVSDRVVGLSQYWDWKAAGFEACPGATVIYDRAAPIYHPDDPKEHEDFVEQRREIRRIVFDEEHLPDADSNVTFWSTVKTQGGHGVVGKEA